MSDVKVAEKWVTTNIGDILLELTDYTANGSFESLKNHVQYYSNEEYAVLVRTTDLNKRYFIPQRFTDYKGWKFLKKTALYGNEIVIANVGSVGNVYRVPFYSKPMTLAPNMYLLKFTKDVSEDFLFYILSSKNFKTNLLKQLGSTTLQAINKDNLRHILISLPKFKQEQQKIAEILSEVDSAIDKTKELIEKNKRLKTALMQDLLSYGVDENGQIRNPKTHQFKPSPLGDIPMEWAIKELGKVAFLQRGYDLPSGLRHYGRYKIYGSNGVDGYHNDYAVKSPTIVTGRSGTIGKVHYEETDCWPLNTTLYVKNFYANDPKFIKSLLEILDLKSFSASTGVPSLNRNFIHPVEVKIPLDIREQQKIADILSSQDEKIEKLQNKLTKLNHLKTSLMQDLLSGEVRVNKLLESKQ